MARSNSTEFIGSIPTFMAYFTFTDQDMPASYKTMEMDYPIQLDSLLDIRLWYSGLLADEADLHKTLLRKSRRRTYKNFIIYCIVT